MPPACRLPPDYTRRLLLFADTATFPKLRNAYTRINGYKHAMRELSDIFKALGDVTRLRILALLIQHGELCVCDIENVIGATQSKTSRHLRYLLHAGLVQDRRVGVWVHYRISPDSDGRIGIIRRALKKLLTPELTADLNARFTQQCCVDGVCVPASAKASAGRPARKRREVAAK